MIPKFKPT